MNPPLPKTLRLLVVLPSWVGDAVMATPTLRLLRQGFPGAFIGVMVRPGIDELLAGTGLFDEAHVADGSGVMGPKRAATKLRPRRYDTALLLTNSFSTALVTRLAGIPRRIGYARDGRSLLLTDRLAPPVRVDGTWAPVPAVQYYRTLACEFLLDAVMPGARTAPVPMELAASPKDIAAGEAILSAASLRPGEAFAVLNPGGNNAAKRWPAERFAELARWLHHAHGLRVLINGSPSEADLCATIAAQSEVPCGVLPKLGITLGSLKAVVRRAALMVTNDTGPRHIAAAFGVPLVSLFGPTDHRWTTIPTRPDGPEQIVLADPELPESELANDHPERCRVDRITSDTVRAAVVSVLARRRPGYPGATEQ